MQSGAARTLRRVWGRSLQLLHADVALIASDAVWSLPLALYRLSGRRVARFSQLYRAGVLRQQFERSRIPGMTALTERAYLKWHAQEELTGAGAVVDLGSWLGSTTASLAMGLAANPRRSTRTSMIHAYDQFRWEGWMDIHSPPTRLGPYKPGDSFRPEFELVVKRWRERIAVHEGDLLQETWRNGPIELLIVDAMKSWELASHIVRELYPALLPTSGHLMHQDFSHCFTPWIPLISYRLIDFLVPARDIPRSESLVFRVASAVPPRASRFELGRSSFDDFEIEQAFRHWLDVTPAEKHSGLRAARVLLSHYDGDIDQAESLRQSFTNRGLLNEFHINTLHAVMDR